jgi:hypothetical protein
MGGAFLPARPCVGTVEDLRGRSCGPLGWSVLSLTNPCFSPSVRHTTHAHANARTHERSTMPPALPAPAKQAPSHAAEPVLRLAPSPAPAPGALTAEVLAMHAAQGAYLAWRQPPRATTPLAEGGQRQAEGGLRQAEGGQQREGGAVPRLRAASLVLHEGGTLRRLDVAFYEAELVDCAVAAARRASAVAAVPPVAAAALEAGSGGGGAGAVALGHGPAGERPQGQGQREGERQGQEQQAGLQRLDADEVVAAVGRAWVQRLTAVAQQ